MREIKFKLVDNNNFVLGPYTIEEIYKIGEGLNWDNCKWIQFTGLKDKNGKEIYEGDILKTSYISEKIIMEFYDGAFGYRYLKTFCKQGSSEGMTSMMKEWEIISNIYESPELLK